MTYPAPPTTRAPGLCDTECFRPFWLWKFRPIGGATLTVRLYAGQRLTDAQRSLILAAHAHYLTVTFNGKFYDEPMIRAALAGFTPEELKQLNDCLIRPKDERALPSAQCEFLRSKGWRGNPYDGKLMPWHFDFLPPWAPADHVDIMQTLPGKGSLKVYAARIHCKTIRDLPYDPDHNPSAAECLEIEAYCETDLDDLNDEYLALGSLLKVREILGKRYGLDLRSKSDPQMAEAVLHARCEAATGRKLYKNEIDWNLTFKYQIPHFIGYSHPQLVDLLQAVERSIFRLGGSGHVIQPPALDDRTVTLGGTTYTFGIGGLHSTEKRLVCVTNDTHVLLFADVASYYPNLIINSGQYPPALGPTFTQEYKGLMTERLSAKAERKRLKAQGITTGAAYDDAEAGDEGGKVMINGTFGKTSEQFSKLYGPQLMIQTTLTGQLATLMLIEWLEHYGCPVVSSNTDGIVIYCPRTHEATARWLIGEWERRLNLVVEIDEYKALYARDVNSYFAVRTPEDVKRKGAYSKASLIHKISPDVEICSDAVEAYLAYGTPIEYTIASCVDIRKFVTVQVVAGGGVKMHGHGAVKGAQLRRDMMPVLAANGWIPALGKGQRGKWICKIPGAALEECTLPAAEAYLTCFDAQRPEYMGKVCRWYYATNCPGPILYKSNGHTVGLSYGAKPCQTLPDSFPDDVDLQWYVNYAQQIMRDTGINN